MRIPVWNRLSPERKRSTKFLGLSFLIPFLFILSAFIVQQVHPFGTKMILTVDLYHQYAPFVAELRDKLLHGDSLFYSWNVSLGSNFWAVFANYAASPLNLLLLPIPEKFLSDGIALVVCLRVGLTGLFTALLLRDIDRRREDLFLSVFAAVYALNGWVLSYFWNIMWHDALMLLPLVILGLRRMMRDKKPVLFFISLFLVIWSNYYAAYFVCFFLILYAPVLYVSLFDRLTIRNFFSSLWRFALYAALAGGSAAALLYPTWMTLKESSATGDTFPTDWALKQEMFDFFGRFFVVSNPNIRDGMANVYTGVLLALMIPLFFLCKRILLREKIAYGLLMAFLYFSFSSRIMDFIWHGFHFPNQIPFRQAFLMSFLIVIMGYRVLRNLKSFSLNEVTVAAAAAVGYLILYGKFAEEGESDIALYVTLLFVIAYAAVLRMILIGRHSVTAQRYALCSVILIELLVATQSTVGLVSMHEGFTGWDFYGKKGAETTAFVEQASATDTDAFFRTEMYPAFICNQPALYHVKGMSVFSSTADESFVQFMRSLGFHNNGINGVRNYGLTPVTATLFGIEYFIDVNDASPIPSGFSEVSNEDLRVFRNEDALSVGYMVPSSITEFRTENRNHPFVTTNLFLKALGAETIYVDGSILTRQTTNMSMISENPVSGYVYRITEAETKAEISFAPDAKTVGSHMYIYVQASKAPSVTVTETDPETGTRSSKTTEVRTQQIIDIGIYAPERDKEVVLTWNSPAAEQFTLYCYSMNDEAYRSMVDSLDDQQLQVTRIDSTSLQGTIDVKTQGTLLLTVPYDKGWSATVDGRTVELIPVGEALTAIDLTVGTHEIHMTYLPEGMKIGGLISLGSFMIFLALAVLPPLLRKFISRRRPGGDLATAEQAPEGEINPPAVQDTVMEQTPGEEEGGAIDE